MLSSNLSHSHSQLAHSPISQWIHSGDAASPALIELLEIELSTSSPIVDYIVQHVSEAVAHGSSEQKHMDLTRFTTFVSNVLTKCKATMPVILLTLVYIDRVRPRLHIICEQFAHERVFLGALMVARKFVCDCNYRCKHWSRFTGLFGPRDISRIEREFLQVLRFDLTFTESELLAHHDGIISGLSAPKPHHFFFHSSEPTRCHEGCNHPLYSDHPTDSHFVTQRLTPESPHESTASSPSSEESIFSDVSSPETDDDHSSPETPETPPHELRVEVLPVAKDATKKRTSFLSLFNRGHNHDFTTAS